MAYVGMGSNLGDREAFLRSGLEGMARGGLVAARVSSVWETQPVDSPGSPWFLNAVAGFEAAISPLEMLDLLLAVERDVGRVRTVRNAPRVLDLDLLLMGELCVDGPRLALPHPRMWSRRFVLDPLAEIAPGLRDPRSGRSVEEALAALRTRERVRRLGPLVPGGGRGGL